MTEKLGRSVWITVTLALLGAQLASAAAAGDEAMSESCVLQTLELEDTGQETLLRIATAGDPVAIGARIEPDDSVVLDLAGCVPGPGLAGGDFAEGLVAALQLEPGSDAHRPSTAVTVRIRGAFEYSVSAQPGVVLARFRAKPGATTGKPSSQKPIRVLEPLPTAVSPRPPLLEPLPPAAPAGQTPEPAPPAQNTAITSAIEAWARAWSERRIEDYLAAYASGFRPPQSLSRPAWEAQRRRRLADPDWIQVTLEDLEVRVIETGRAVAAFFQGYRSDTYSDRVHKTLTLVEENGRWRILLEVIQKPVDPD